MFTELLQTELWRKRLETAGYRVVAEAWSPAREEPRRDSRERMSQPPPLPVAATAARP